MNARFFKKHSPSVALYLSTGDQLKFTIVDPNVGVLIVDADKHPEIIREIENAQREERGGIITITAQEYEDLVQKKTTPRVHWREEFGRSVPKNQGPPVLNAFVTRAGDDTQAAPPAPVVETPLAPSKSAKPAATQRA